MWKAISSRTCMVWWRNKYNVMNKAQMLSILLMHFLSLLVQPHNSPMECSTPSKRYPRFVGNLLTSIVSLRIAHFILTCFYFVAVGDKVWNPCPRRRLSWRISHPVHGKSRISASCFWLPPSWRHQYLRRYAQSRILLHSLLCNIGCSCMVVNLFFAVRVCTKRLFCDNVQRQEVPQASVLHATGLARWSLRNSHHHGFVSFFDADN